MTFDNIPEKTSLRLSASLCGGRSEILHPLLANSEQAA